MKHPLGYPNCVDCKFHRTIVNTSHKCYSPITTDLVTGELRPITCDNMRYGEPRKSYIICGISGQYFKDKLS
jgi:hypothetical protein